LGITVALVAVLVAGCGGKQASPPQPQVSPAASPAGRPAAPAG
jgi:plastocyanin